MVVDEADPHYIACSVSRSSITIGAGCCSRRERTCTREQPELDDLRAHQGERDEREHRVDLPGAAEDVDRARCQQQHPREPERQEDAAWNEVEPARAVEEHEADVTPGVCKGA